DSGLLERLRGLSSGQRTILLALRNADGRWHVTAQAGGRGAPSLLAFPANPPRISSSEVDQQGHHLLRVTARLDAAKGSAPIVVALSYPLDEALAAFRSIV